MPNRNEDVVVDEVRAVRRQISARFEHDPERLVAYYQELQKRYADRLLEKKTAKGDKNPSAA